MKAIVIDSKLKIPLRHFQIIQFLMSFTELIESQIAWKNLCTFRQKPNSILVHFSVVKVTTDEEEKKKIVAVIDKLVE